MKKYTQEDLDTALKAGQTDFSNCDLSKLNLEGADLEKADLYNTDLHGANLEGANMHGTNLRWTDLLQANLPKNLRIYYSIIQLLFIQMVLALGAGAIAMLNGAILQMSK